MTLLLSAGGEDAGLMAELQRADPPRRGHVERPGLVVIPDEPMAAPLPAMAWVRQAMPQAESVQAPSIRAWAQRIVQGVESGFGENASAPWRLQIGAHYGVRVRPRMGARAWHSLRQHPRSPRPQVPEANSGPPAHAGQHRCTLIREAVLALLQERRRHLARRRSETTAPFTQEEGLVQVLLTSAETGWVSVLGAPTPWRWRQTLSPFELGVVERASDLAAPSRAFAKLVEAEARMGCRIAAGETCVDLGASPGSWSYVALQRGAKVLAVDRAPLRADLMANPRLQFVRDDAFGFQPKQPVDWLLCDVIAPADRSVALVLDWLRNRWAKKFVVTLKVRGAAEHVAWEPLKKRMPELAEEWFLTHLEANKGEVTVFGWARST